MSDDSPHACRLSHALKSAAATEYVRGDMVKQLQNGLLWMDSLHWILMKQFSGQAYM
jgi:hypothetical protein